MVAFRYARFIMPAAITLKGIPDDLYERLKRSAKAHHRSLNSEVIACLERQLAPQALSVDERLARAHCAPAWTPRSSTRARSPKRFAQAVRDRCRHQRHCLSVPAERAHVLTLACSSGCSAYDCEFVALARHLNTRLVTVDQQLVRRFKSTAVSLKRALQ
jgi:antitoxin FitA